MQICRWCGTSWDDHTEKQKEAAVFFLETLGPAYAWDAPVVPRISKKLSKQDQH